MECKSLSCLVLSFFQKLCYLNFCASLICNMMLASKAPLSATPYSATPYSATPYFVPPHAIQISVIWLSVGYYKFLTIFLVKTLAELFPALRIYDLQNFDCSMLWIHFMNIRLRTDSLYVQVSFQALYNFQTGRIHWQEHVFVLSLSPSIFERNSKKKKVGLVKPVSYLIRFLLSGIWLPQGQVWAIIKRQSHSPDVNHCFCQLSTRRSSECRCVVGSLSLGECSVRFQAFGFTRSTLIH